MIKELVSFLSNKDVETLLREGPEKKYEKKVERVREIKKQKHK